MRLKQFMPLLNALRPWLPNRGSVLLVIVAMVLLRVTQAGATQSAPAAPSASTNTIPYQGRLADAAGRPLSGTYVMKFNLYATAAGGSALWTETWNSVAVSDGLFNVLLGSVAMIPPGVIAGNANLWLGIAVGTDAELTPRIQLGAVPFAMRALTVPDGSIAAAQLADGSVTWEKLATDATIPSSILSWSDDTDRTFPAASTGSNYTVDPNLTVTVPPGKAYHYVVTYRGILQYFMSERVGSSPYFHATWNAEFMANTTAVGGESVIVATGYNFDWTATGGLFYWQAPYTISWFVRLESGTHALRVRINGHSDNLMNTAHIRRQHVQVMRVR